MFLLAQFREKCAYPLLVDFFYALGDNSPEAIGMSSPDTSVEYLLRTAVGT